MFRTHSPNQSRNPFKFVFWVVCSPLVSFLPMAAFAQDPCPFCGQGLAGQAQVFGTNCNGAPVPNLARAGSTVGFKVGATFINNCALDPACLQGDQSVITNVFFTITNACLPGGFFTSANL